MTEMYDVIAELCSYLIEYDRDNSLFVMYSCLSDAADKTILEDISQSLPSLVKKVGDNNSFRVHMLAREELDMVFFQQLRNYIGVLEENKDCFSLLRLVQVLDEAMGSLLLEKIREYQSDSFSLVLNANREATGVGLLPRTSCVWERKHRLSHSYDRMDNFLFNILLLENSILGELIDKHIFLSSRLFPRFEKERSVRIAATPLCNERPFIIERYERDRVSCFSIRYDPSEYKIVNELIWQKITAAAQEMSDIIVFPELMGNPETENYITRKLSSLSEKEKDFVPSLIILPSVCGSRMNSVTVMDKHGNILCRQSKQNRFREKYEDKSYLEDIVANNVVSIFHYEGIGRIAVLICKDFLTTKYMEQLMRCFKLTLIIVPSFSTGSFDFYESLDLCAHDDCNVVWINTCAALEKGKEGNFKNIGYVRKRIGRNDDDSQKLCRMPICGGAFSGECSRDCIYFETIRGV